MLRGSTIAALFLLLGGAFIPVRSLAHGSAGWERANEVVKPSAYVSLEPVPRGRTFELAVVAEIQPGFHINAHEVLESYLIPTELEATLPKDFRLLEAIYPPGELRKFAFSQNKLSVYTGKVILRLRLEAGPAAPLGEQNLPMMLHYQACNDQMCLPPVKLPVAAELKVAPAGAAAHPVNSLIFGGAAKLPKQRSSH